METEAGDAAEGLVHGVNFFRDGLRRADEQCAGGAEQRVEVAARDGRPTALAADLGEGARVAREKLVGGLLVGLGNVAEHVQTDVKFFGRVAGLRAGLAIQVDQRTEPVRLSADDRDHERQAEFAGTGKGRRRAADAEPDRKLGLQRTRENTLVVQRGAVASAPRDRGFGADFEQEFQLLLKERIVVFEVEAEERVGFDEGAASGDDFGAALRDQVDGGEVLEDAHGIVGAEHGDGAGESDVFGDGRGRAENDGGRRIEEVVAVVFTDAEDVESALVGEGDLFEQLLETLDGRGSDSGDRIGTDGDKTIQAKLHKRTVRADGCESNERLGVNLALPSERAASRWVAWPLPSWHFNP